MTRKLDSAYPIIAQIRKGAPKNAQGHVGPDLKDRFRVIFFPGADHKFISPLTGEAQKTIPERYNEIYKTQGGLQPTVLRAMIPAQTVWEGFSSYNETYNANIRVAQADDEHYLNLRDPGNGYQYLVRNGEPYRPYNLGDVVTYKGKDGKTVTLKIKVYNRLKLFLPEIEEFVYFEFRSTAYYDRQNITQQLGAIQDAANLLNGGVAAGVPFYMYRALRDLSYIEKGEAKRTKQWLIQLKVDPEWAKQAIRRMSNYALTGEGFTLTLQSENDPAPLEVPAPPPGTSFEDDDEADDDILDGEARDVPPPPASQPAPTPRTRRLAGQTPHDLPPTLPPAPKNGNGNGTKTTQAHADANSPLTTYNRLGQMLWQSKWPEASAAITRNINPASLAKEDIKKALELVQKRYSGISDLKKLAEHIKKVWPNSDIAADLAHTFLASTSDGTVDHLILIQAVDQADAREYESPEAHAQAIVGHYLRLIPQPA